MDEAGSCTQSKLTEEKLEWGLGYLRGILLNILQRITVSSSFFPLLPFTYHTIPKFSLRKFH